MHCLQASQLISKSQDERLSTQEKVGLKLHLMVCHHCRQFQQNCTELRKITKDFQKMS